MCFTCKWHVVSVWKWRWPKCAPYRHILRHSETCFAHLMNVFVHTALWSAVLPWFYSPYFWLILRCYVSLWLAVCRSTDPQPVAVVVVAAQHSQLTGFTDLQKGYCCFGPAGLQSLLTVNRAHLWPVCTWLQLWPSQRGGCISVAHVYTLNKCANHPQQTLY